MRSIREDLRMIHGFIPTIAIAVIGLSAARLGDLLRTPLNNRKPGDAAHAWRYKTESAPSKREWLSSRPHLSPCCNPS
jgi:hypothetical protein